MDSTVLAASVFKRSARASFTVDPDGEAADFAGGLDSV
jgi:hypothetical protein